MNILLTAGPTREYLDPVRYLSNASTGRMGFALTQAAIESGHSVTVVSGPVTITWPESVRVLPVISAVDMLEAVLREMPAHDALIACAAVADYRPANRTEQKIKKSEEALSLELVRNPDILAEVGLRYAGQKFLLGFALESENGEANARAKMAAKKLDAIVLNHPAALGADESSALLLTADGGSQAIGPAPKLNLARKIIGLLAPRR